eukprot:12298914-Alexandrium_andersonii.AAC.1
MSASLVGSEMCIRDSRRRRAKRGASGARLWKGGAPNFCRLRAPERAVWSLGRAGTASSRA